MPLSLGAYEAVRCGILLYNTYGFFIPCLDLILINLYKRHKLMFILKSYLDESKREKFNSFNN